MEFRGADLTLPMRKGAESFPSIEEQQRVYDFFFDRDVQKFELVDGTLCVIICKDWFDKWRSFIRRSKTDDIENGNIEERGDPPGKLEVSSITSHGKLRNNLLLGVDLTCVPEDLFKKLVAWYGFEGDEKSIPFRKIYSIDKKESSFDLYPPVLSLLPLGDYRRFDIECNSRETIGYIKECIRKNNGLDSGVEIRLYDAENEDKLPDDEKATLKECSLEGEKTINYAVVLKSAANGDGPFEFPSFRHSNSSYPVGVCGLYNIGNTCFMNSVIQCIASIDLLRNFLLADDFEDNINSENKLGSGGSIARAFARLVGQMWSEGSRAGSCVPRELKMQIAKFAPRFAGYQQQDAQELMNFLLDFLNEDLTRIKEKSYVEVKDADGRPDDEVAEEAWNNFKKCNDSVIVDLFYGLLKSTVTCPVCNYVSVTFDPFNVLNLPLSDCRKTITVWPKGSYNLPVAPSCRAKDILTSLERNHLLHGERECVVTTFDKERLQVIPFTSEESLRDPTVLIFNLTKGFRVQIILRVNGRLELYPFLISLGVNQRRFTKKDLIPLITSELSSICTRYGKQFESFADAKRLDFDPDNEVYDSKDDSPISIRLPETLNIELPGKIERRDLQLADCIDLFLASEQLGNRDLWYCKKCKQHRQAFKKLDLWSLPQVLVIHLKRYGNSRLRKNETYVDYPVEDLKVTCIKGTTVYDLVAVSNHRGCLGGGHYTAFAKIKKKWYRFDDSIVDILEGSVVTGDAYILVYMFKDPIHRSPEANNGH